MRIGLVIYGSLTTLSGGYLYDRKLVAYLKEHGDNVEIISLPRRNYLHHLEDNFSNDLMRRLVNLQCDVLLQDELNHPSLFLLNRRIKDKISYPIISIVHHLRCCEENPIWLNRFYRLVESHYLSSLDGFICNSRSTLEMVEDLIRNCGNQHRSSLVAYPGGNRFHQQISKAEISQRAREDHVLNLLFIGNIIPRKGLHILLKALKRLPENQFILNIVGNPEADLPYFLNIKRQIEQNDMTNQVRFAGVLSDNDLCNCMKKSHLLVMPSYYEGYGIAYLEGMGFGLPAIGTNRGGAREIVISGLNGFLIDPGDDAKLALYLRQLSQDRGLLLKMSLKALDHYISRPDWEQSMENIRIFLGGLI
ncbi:MAG: glycosyltransferase family 4 protein [Methanotrichaceae archaeon]|nr:glycosyltransferase family 4 protein [Methanotrichaceae archaeon]